ncbi:MAG: sigma-70 family RNA polymerase sigma factor [Planctomycetota bacterium]|nr:sigma-70 family RNA polymerase sigma factor [Planctomycetota bacterium]
MADTLHRTDEELVEDYLDGDVGAFRLLIERHHDSLLRFLFRLTGNRQTAEDAFQDAFLQVHQSLESFDRTRSFKPWLFTIAANKARDALRKIQRRSAISLSARASSASGDEGDALVDLMAINLPGPDLPLEEREQSRLVQSAVDAMPPRMREILLLAYFQRMSYQQIAEQLSIPVGTVKSRLHAAVASFAKAWEAQTRAEKSDSRTKAAREPGT